MSRRLRSFVVLVLALLLAASRMADPAFAQAKRVALVIGNSAYKHTTRLTNPKNDANDVAAKLKALGFGVVEGIDLDKAATDRTILAFAEKLTGAEVGLFFYAGHGMQVGGQNYLVPTDAKLATASAIDFEMVRLDLVQRTMEREASTNIIIIDACRDNPLSRNLARALGTRSTQVGHGLASAESGEGSLISFSTQPGNVALDGDGRNSPFAEALLKHMGAPGEDLSTILINVRNDVMRATARKQVPWEHSAMTAKFYFTAPTPPREVELTFWMSVKDSTSPAVLGTYLERFPDGEFAPVARALIDHYSRQMQLEQAARETERKRREEETRAAEVKRLEDAQRARETTLAEERKRAEAAKSGEARQAADQQLAELKKALDEVRLAREAAAEAEKQRVTALKAAEEAAKAAEQAIASKRAAEKAASPEKLAALPQIGRKVEPSSGAGPFNGSWQIQWKATSGCAAPGGAYTLQITDGVLRGRSRTGPVAGRVSEKGAVRWTVPSFVDNAPITCTGTMGGSAGSGSCSRQDGRCNQSFSMKRS